MDGQWFGLPWWSWPAIIGGMMLGLGTIWKLGIVGGSRALWAFILAMPKIADGIQEALELLRGDVLTRLEQGAERFAHIESRVNEEASVTTHLEGRVEHVEQVVIVHTEKLATHEQTLAEIRGALRIIGSDPPTT